METEKRAEWQDVWWKVKEKEREIAVVEHRRQMRFFCLDFKTYH
jgi:hypothetical protein